MDRTFYDDAVLLVNQGLKCKVQFDENVRPDPKHTEPFNKTALKTFTTPAEKGHRDSTLTLHKKDSTCKLEVVRRDSHDYLRPIDFDE